MTYLEIQFWRVAKWIIKRGYGAECPPPKAKECASCSAEKVIEWIDSHIELLKI